MTNKQIAGRLRDLAYLHAPEDLRLLADKLDQPNHQCGTYPPGIAIETSTDNDFWYPYVTRDELNVFSCQYSRVRRIDDEWAQIPKWVRQVITTSGGQRIFSGA